MANVSPFLQMLLNRKKNDPSIYTPENTPPDLPLEGQGPTIALRPKPVMPQTDSATAPITNSPSDIDKIAALGTLPQQPTVPVRPALSQGIDMNAPDVVPAATIPLGSRAPMIAGKESMPNDVAGQTSIPLPPRDVIQEDRDALKAAQSKHPGLGRRILEGLGTYAASGIGLNLRPILHPGGTDEQKAQRQLANDLGIQKAQTEDAGTRSTIALHDATTRKLKAELDNPDTSDADKAEAKAVMDGLEFFKGQLPNPVNDARYAELKKRAAGLPHPITLPDTYGPRAPKAEAGFTLPPGGGRYDASGKLIVERAPTEKPEPTMTPNETFNADKEFQNANAKKKSLTDSADSAVREGNAHLAARKTADERIAQINATLKAPGNATDADLETLRQERAGLIKESANRQKQADEQFKTKDSLLKQAGEIVPVAPPKISARKPRPGKESPTTHVLSQSAWLASHKGQEAQWPKAVEAAKAAGYQIVQ